MGRPSPTHTAPGNPVSSEPDTQTIRPNRKAALWNLMQCLRCMALWFGFPLHAAPTNIRLGTSGRGSPQSLVSDTAVLCRVYLPGVSVGAVRDEFPNHSAEQRRLCLQQVEQVHFVQGWGVFVSLGACIFYTVSGGGGGLEQVTGLARR